MDYPGDITIQSTTSSTVKAFAIHNARDCFLAPQCCDFFLRTFLPTDKSVHTPFMSTYLTTPVRDLDKQTRLIYITLI